MSPSEFFILAGIIGVGVVAGFMAGLQAGAVRADRIQRHLRHMAEEAEQKRREWPRTLSRMQTGGLN